MRLVAVCVLALAGSVFALSLPSTPAGAHCEVPCGIFDDAGRFTQMLEDHSTIAKAMVQIRDLAEKKDALSLNQGVRWVMTKEDHATKVMDTIAQYFMAQRIKPGADEAAQGVYIDQLTKAHAVMTSAMRCKQSVADADAKGLHDAIHAFQTAYTKK
ncbi:MAG: superoxide dismutase [Ni] [Planctomycetota bacterium]